MNYNIGYQGNRDNEAYIIVSDSTLSKLFWVRKKRDKILENTIKLPVDKIEFQFLE